MIEVQTLTAVIGLLVSTFYAAAALYLVFGTSEQIPFKYPFLYGALASSLHLAMNEPPGFWPLSLPFELITITLLLSAFLLGLVLLGFIIKEYRAAPRPWLLRLHDWLC